MKALYTSEELLNIVEPLLSEKRFFHTVCVAEEAVRLANRFGCDPSKAEAAGLLHDIMKDTDFGEQLKILGRFGIILTGIEKISMPVWHQITGAVYIQNTLGIDDDEIVNAVRYHTTGRKGMGILEKVVYIADAVSADRQYKGADDIRLALEKGLDEAMAVNTGLVIRSFAKKLLPIVPDTFEAYNEAVTSLINK